MEAERGSIEVLEAGFRALAVLLARQAAAEYLSAIGQEPSRQPSIRIPPSLIKGATGEHEPEVAG